MRRQMRAQIKKNEDESEKSTEIKGERTTEFSFFRKTKTRGI